MDSAAGSSLIAHRKGSVAGLHVTPTKRGPLERVDEVRILADRGVDGDHHQRPGSSRQVMLVESSVLDDLLLDPGSVREQICLSGLELAAGDLLTIGEVTLEIVKPRIPCHVMDEVRPGLRAALEGRAGWCARAVSSGTVCVGDVVERGRVDDPTWLHSYRGALAAYEASPPQNDEGGWGTEQRLAHLIAWNERCIARLDALASGAPQEQFTPEQVDAFNGDAVRRHEHLSQSDLYRLHDVSATAVIDSARRHGDLARDWVTNLARHYREHAEAAASSA